MPRKPPEEMIAAGPELRPRLLAAAPSADEAAPLKLPLRLPLVEPVPLVPAVEPLAPLPLVLP